MGLGGCDLPAHARCRRSRRWGIVTCCFAHFGVSSSLGLFIDSGPIWLTSITGPRIFWR
jgi:hypothetical protein